MPQLFQVHDAIDQGFQMKYCMSIHFKWFGRNKRSNLKLDNLLDKNGLFLELSTQTFCISKNTLAIYSYNTSFESPNQRLHGLRRAKVWQHSYLVPHPFEICHFTTYRGKGAVLSGPICIPLDKIIPPKIMAK